MKSEYNYNYITDLLSQRVKFVSNGDRVEVELPLNSLGFYTYSSKSIDDLITIFKFIKKDGWEEVQFNYGYDYGDPYIFATLSRSSTQSEKKVWKQQQAEEQKKQEEYDRRQYEELKKRYG